MAIAIVTTIGLVYKLAPQAATGGMVWVLGGLLVFRGLHWLVIENQTVPVVVGGSQNVYSLLTTYYLPEIAGGAGRIG